MLAAIIFAGVAVACLTQGAIEGAIAMGILAVVLYFMFGSNKASRGKTTTPPKPKPEQREEQPAAQYRATPALIAHYKSSPVVAQIAREIRNKGAQEHIYFSRDGGKLTASGGGFYVYVFRDHGYQSLTLQEQEAFLLALVGQFPHAETYMVKYDVYEGKTTPLSYGVSTPFYRQNHYRWNADTHAWEKMTKL